MTFFSTRKLVSVCNHIHLVLSLPHTHCGTWKLRQSLRGTCWLQGLEKRKHIIYSSPQVSGEGLAFELTRVHTVPCGWGFLLNHRKITSASEVDTRSMEGSRHGKSESSEHQTIKGELYPHGCLYKKSSSHKTPGRRKKTSSCFWGQRLPS